MLGDTPNDFTQCSAPASTDGTSTCCYALTGGSLVIEAHGESRSVKSLALLRYYGGSIAPYHEAPHLLSSVALRILYAIFPSAVRQACVLVDGRWTVLSYAASPYAEYQLFGNAGTPCRTLARRRRLILRPAGVLLLAAGVVEALASEELFGQPLEASVAGACPSYADARDKRPAGQP
jgi:hypothetical protein